MRKRLHPKLTPLQRKFRDILGWDKTYPDSDLGFMMASNQTGILRELEAAAKEAP